MKNIEIFYRENPAHFPLQSSKLSQQPKIPTVETKKEKPITIETQLKNINFHYLNQRVPITEAPPK